MQKDVWLYSWDDEYFASDEYESKEEAIEAAKEELRRLGEFGRLVYVGQKKEVNIPDIDAGEALERVQDKIDNEFGGYGEDWFENIRVEDILILESRISEVFKKWINEFGYKPYWFVVTDTEEIELKDAINEN
ncbi:hypothetical protein NQ830_12365 [Clostridioides difficile]|uniref:hypothetical protein n=1 Tax=Clostridioides difficile TaxID=1496 RepID=UPI00038D9C7C|nr:hypothetical protein [Clostridioides difficile]EQJ88665.1 hypothetical protein QUC_3342 [Clostridioides difficile P50]MCO8835453.1 hypothetical protein [Clostridioides difficile]MCR1410126.1 hypothetical protein [Clostridioides difficile]MCR1421114.1 hypothetical protein [Clostridioides difficile]MDI0326357.1 hypothetical protein [Clostridioides difficile]